MADGAHLHASARSLHASRLDPYWKMIETASVKLDVAP